MWQIVTFAASAEPSQRDDSTMQITVATAKRARAKRRHGEGEHADWSEPTRPEGSVLGGQHASRWEDGTLSVRLSLGMRTCFVTAQPHAHVRFRRAIERRALWLAEDAARELPNLPLEDALRLVHLYFERGSPKAEPAARRWLGARPERGVRLDGEMSPGSRQVWRSASSRGAELDGSLRRPRPRRRQPRPRTRGKPTGRRS